MRDNINAAHKLREKNMAEARKALDDKVSVVKQRVAEQVKKVTTTITSVPNAVTGAAGNIASDLKILGPTQLHALEEGSSPSQPVIDHFDLRPEEEGEDDSPPGEPPPGKPGLPFPAHISLIARLGGQNCPACSPILNS